MQPGGQGSSASSRNGVWGGAPAEIEFCTFLIIFTSKNLTSSGNDSNDFYDDQLAKFRTVQTINAFHDLYDRLTWKYTCCSLIIGGARLMHDPLGKYWGGPPGPQDRRP